MGPMVLFFFNALKTSSDYATDSLGLPKNWTWSNLASA